MREIIETFTHKNGGTTNIYYDEGTFEDSPREWYNLGTFVTWHERYNSPDEHNIDCDEFFHEIAGVEVRDYDPELNLKTAVSEAHKTHIIIPVYAYEHGAIAYSTSPFSCAWDSGQIGFIYVSKKKVLKEYGGKIITKALRGKVEKVLALEVSTYNQWANGEIYCFETLDSKGEHVDSCGGFYSVQDVIESASVEIT